MCHVKARQKHNFFSNFRIGTGHLILFGCQVVTHFFGFPSLWHFYTICVFPAQVSQCNARHLYRFGKNILGSHYICIGFKLCLRSIVGLPAPALASYVPLCSARCAKGEPLRLCFQLTWLSTSVEKAKN